MLYFTWLEFLSAWIWGPGVAGQPFIPIIRSCTVVISQQSKSHIMHLQCRTWKFDLVTELSASLKRGDVWFKHSALLSQDGNGEIRFWNATVNPRLKAGPLKLSMCFFVSKCQIPKRTINEIAKESWCFFLFRCFFKHSQVHFCRIWMLTIYLVYVGWSHVQPSYVFRLQNRVTFRD